MVCFSRGRSYRRDAIKATPIVTVTNIDLLFEFVIDPLGVFDHPAVHVSNIECPIRANPNPCGTAPRIARSKKLALCFAGQSLTLKCCTVGQQLATVDQIPGRFAGKGVLCIGGAKQVVTINNGAAGRGKNSRRSDRTDAGVAMTDHGTGWENAARSV